MGGTGGRRGNRGRNCLSITRTNKQILSLLSVRHNESVGGERERKREGLLQWCGFVPPIIFPPDSGVGLIHLIRVEIKINSRRVEANSCGGRGTHRRCGSANTLIPYNGINQEELEHEPEHEYGARGLEREQQVPLRVGFEFRSLGALVAANPLYCLVCGSSACNRRMRTRKQQIRNSILNETRMERGKKENEIINQ